MAGWRIALAGGTQLDVLVSAAFPYVAPRIALVDPPAFLTWPHVEEDGALCLLEDQDIVDYARPVETLQHLLGEAAALIEDSLAERNSGDFILECNTYWSNAAGKLRAWLSLVRLGPPSRRIVRWIGPDRSVIADSRAELQTWVQHYSGREGIKNDEFSEAFFLWMDAPLYPSQFPRTAADLRALTRAQGGSNALDLLESLVTAEPDKLSVVLAAPTGSGAFMGAAIASRPKESGHGALRRQKVKGFRDKHLPVSVARQQFFGSKAVERVDVWRTDAAWIHGRDTDPDLDRLRGCRIAVVGCGSLGASVTTLLAQSGVGSFILIDPDTLTPPNTTRHPLGAQSVSHNKATALGKELKRDFPGICSVTEIPRRWEQLREPERQQIRTCDLILVAIGNVGVEFSLNEWARRPGINRPVVYAWLEPFAAAAQGVAILSKGGCFQCGFDAHSHPLLRATEWPNGKTVEHEPGCAATFQPYGAVELMAGASSVAELALDCLQGRLDRSTHTIRVTSEPRLRRYGGQWSGGWLKLTNHPEGDFSLTREWDLATTCPQCHPAPVP